MSGEKHDYTEQIERLGLTPEQGEELIGALQRIAEGLLDKHYMLEGVDAENRK